MACGATLKRSLEFDPLHSPSARSPKRRRCTPMTMSPASSPSNIRQSNSSPSPFTEVYPKLTGEQIAANISAEIRRMQRRRQIQYPHSPSQSGSESPSPPPPEASPGATEISLPSTSSQKFFNALSPSKRDLPLFTFKQVSLVCERMLKDREQQIREEYDKVLTCKLAEQYEAFLKFNHDQIHRRFTDTTASYVS